MEAIASFLILFIFYFLGSLAVIQLLIKPIRRRNNMGEEITKEWKTNHFKILAISFVLSLVTTTIAYMVFP